MARHRILRLAVGIGIGLPAIGGCGGGALGLTDWGRDLLFGFGGLALQLL